MRPAEFYQHNKLQYIRKYSGSVESLLMALIFHQQKMIKALIERLPKASKVGPKPRSIHLNEYDER